MPGPTAPHAHRSPGRRGQFPYLLFAGHPAPVQSGRLDPALVLVRGSPQGVHGSHRSGAELRNGLLGDRHEPVVPTLVHADPGNAQSGRSSGRQGPRCAARDRARACIPRCHRPLLLEQRHTRPSHTRARLYAGHAGAVRALSGRPGGRRVSTPWRSTRPGRRPTRATPI